jgi:outer membrane protein TolC
MFTIKQLIGFRGCLWALTWIILCCPGCVKVGPDFVRPDALVEQNWLESGDRRLQSDSSQNREWWRVFNDPVLDGLIDRAYKENLTLRIAGLRVVESRAQLGIAIGQFFPQTQQAVGSLQQSRISDRSQSALLTTLLTSSQDLIGLSASWVQAEHRVSPGSFRGHRGRL